MIKKGDLGEPLVTDEGYIIGIVSSGLGQCASGGFNLYTNVYRYLNFINESMTASSISRDPIAPPPEPSQN